MPFLSELGEVIHEEHFRMLVMICEVENRVKCLGAGQPINPNDPDDRALLEKVISGLDEVIGHNSFEEAVLFPALAPHAYGELTDHLAQEHLVIGPMAARLRSIAVDTLARGTSFSRWAAFREAAIELAANLMLHLETEEVAIVQKLQFLIEPEVDHALARRYVRERCRANKPALREERCQAVG